MNKAAKSLKTLVPRGGIEPPTRGFSVVAADIPHRSRFGRRNSRQAPWWLRSLDRFLTHDHFLRSRY
jgi:hypothetical protein